MKKIVLQNLKVVIVFFTFQIAFNMLIRYDNLNAITFKKPLIFCLTTTFLFILFIVIYQYTIIKKSRISLDDFDMFPKQSSTFLVNKSIDQIKYIIENILPVKLKSNGFNFNNESSVFVSKTRISFSSWGEKIEIKLIEIDKTNTQLNIISSPLLKTTLIDFGKSSINVHKIRLEFEKNGL